MNLSCPDCGEAIAPSFSAALTAEAELCRPCHLLRFACRECGEQCVSYDDDRPAKQQTCCTCDRIAHADHQRDVEKDERTTTTRSQP